MYMYGSVPAALFPPCPGMESPVGAAKTNLFLSLHATDATDVTRKYHRVAMTHAAFSRKHYSFPASQHGVCLHKNAMVSRSGLCISLSPLVIHLFLGKNFSQQKGEY